MLSSAMMPPCCRPAMTSWRTYIVAAPQDGDEDG
jgi:hypothetical protein